MNNFYRQILTILIIIGLSQLCWGKAIDQLKLYPETADIEGTHQLGEGGSVTWWVYLGTKTIVFEVTYATKGWVGFGIQDFGSVGGLDLIRLGVSDDGTVYFADRYAFRPWRMTKIDESQDYTLISASENDQGTHLKFSRLLETGDELDSVISDRYTFLIWSYGSNDAPETVYLQRGAVRVNFLSPQNN